VAAGPAAHAEGVPDYEATRAAAHVIVDVISGYDSESDEAVSAAAMQTAFERINEVGAFTATRDDETEVTTVDATSLMGAVVVPMRYLIRQVELYSGEDQDAVIVALREWIDENLVDD
jgi:phosphotransferase system HPr-like phosphotransfer protein